MAKTHYIMALAFLALVALPTACIVQGMGNAVVYLNKPGVSADWSVVTTWGKLNSTYAYDAGGNILYKGHYGYYILLGKNDFGAFVAVKDQYSRDLFGSEVNSGAMLSPPAALNQELKWLYDGGVVRGLNPADFGAIESAAFDPNYYAAYQNGSWRAIQTNCNPNGLCYRCGPVPTTADQMPSLGVLEMPAAEGAGAPSPGFVGTSAASQSDQAKMQANGTAGTSQASEEAGFIQYLPYIMGFIVVAGVGALVLYQLAFRQQMVQQFDPATEMALSNETRLGIMRELSEAEKIPTDLSLKLGKSKATVVEHLDKLVGAQLVERIETPGKKFVYYRLTGKGRTALLRRAA